MLTISSLRQARIAVVLLSVSMTLLLFRNSLISLHQSLNFIRSLSNHPGSGIMFFGIPAYMFLFIVTASAGADDISVSIHLSSLEASSVIHRDPSCSDNASILFILLELVLVPLRSLHVFCSWQVTLSSIVYIHLSYKVSSSMLYQMLRS